MGTTAPTKGLKPLYHWANLGKEQRDAAYDAVFAQELQRSVRPPKLNRLATLLGTTPQNLQHYLNARAQVKE